MKMFAMVAGFALCAGTLAFGQTSQPEILQGSTTALPSSEPAVAPSMTAPGGILYQEEKGKAAQSAPSLSSSAPATSTTTATPEILSGLNDPQLPSAVETPNAEPKKEK